MICRTSCLIAIVFIISKFVFVFSIDKGELFQKYQKSLSSEQMKRYIKIVNERRNLSLQGFFLGILLALILLLLNYNIYRMSYKAFACVVLSVVFITQYMYYILSPKSDWMILHLRQDQRQDWLKIYRTMQFKYHLSILIGIISALFLSISFRC